ncbi:unnamed protein product [Adineta ricciae]|uniref:Uncharacterized protein n=1 Tax=Adineta ricciae TaxID=249248 RepID=A0A813UGM4_ADIRI|nr:unnamed protein product [Adineta ricciae]
MMISTPGRKRVQPILIDDDDDEETTDTDVLISSTSSTNNNLAQDLSSFASETPSSASLTDAKPPVKKNLYVPLNFEELSHIRNAQTNGEFATLLEVFSVTTGCSLYHMPTTYLLQMPTEDHLSTK